MGGVGSPMRGPGVGHVDFMLFTSYSLALGIQREPSFQWNTGFRLYMYKSNYYDSHILL